MNDVQILNLSLPETPTAAGVLGRGMRDNPLHVQAFGADPDRRETALTMLFKPLLAQELGKGTVLGAFAAGQLVGVTGMVRPGRCQPTALERMGLLPSVLRSGLKSTLRVLQWVGDWGRHDSDLPHWHLGPVGVERHLQGRGIGGALLREYCRRIDAEGSAGYLETDKPENVTFYKRFGFEVVDEHPVLGVANWFMIREAR